MKTAAAGEEEESRRLGGRRRVLLQTVRVVVASVVLALVGLSGGWAQTAPDGVTYGVVTGRTDVLIEVDRKTYPVSPRLSVRDDYDRPRQWQEVQIGQDVGIQVEEGEVDLIIIILRD